MHAYMFSANSQVDPVMMPDLAAVKAKCRTLPKDSRVWARITLEDHPSDKAAFIAAYNGHPLPARQVIKKWRIGGPRGGKLIEIPVEED